MKALCPGAGVSVWASSLASVQVVKLIVDAIGLVGVPSSWNFSRLHICVTSSSFVKAVEALAD